MSTNLAKFKTTFKNIFSVSTLNLLGLILGFALNLTIAQKFGAGIDTDALFVAISIPNMFIYLSGLDSIKGICRTFIIDYKNDKNRLELFISNLMSPFIAISILMFIASFVLADVLASSIAPGVDTESHAKISYYVRLLSFTILLTGIINLFISVLNAFDQFSSAALTLFIQKITIFLSILFFDSFGLTSVPVAYSIGSLLSLIFVMFKVSKLDIHIQISFSLYSEDFRNFFHLFKPLFLSVLIAQLSNIAYISFCSLVETGTITSFNYAKTVAAVILPVAITPILSIALNKLRENNDNQLLYNSNLLNFYFLTIAASSTICAILSVRAENVITILFERGNFRPEDTLNVANFYETFLISTVIQANCLFFNFVALSKQHTKIILVSNLCVFLGIIVCFVLYLDNPTVAIHRALLTSWTMGLMAYYAYIFYAHRAIVYRVTMIGGACIFVGYLVTHLFSKITTRWFDDNLLTLCIDLSLMTGSCFIIFILLYFIAKKVKLI